MKAPKSLVPFQICLLFLLLQSCRQDVQTFLDSQPLSVEIVDAKHWYDKQKPNNILWETTQYKDITPIWGKAISTGGIIEIPFLEKGLMLMPVTSSLSKNKGRTKLVFKKHPHGYLLFKIDYIPSDNFEGDIKKINLKNFLLNRFEGIIKTQMQDSENENIFTVKNSQYYSNGIYRLRPIGTAVSLSLRDQQCVTTASAVYRYNSQSGELEFQYYTNIQTQCTFVNNGSTSDWNMTNGAPCVPMNSAIECQTQVSSGLGVPSACGSGGADDLYYGNLQITASEFIDMYCKPSIWALFPSNVADLTLDYIKNFSSSNSDLHEAYLLLNCDKFRP